MNLRGRPVPPEPVSTHRVNDQITAREVLLIDAEGRKVGVVPISRALGLAAEASLDLVEVAPMARPPVCRICDHSKLIYEARRKQRDAKRHQRSQEIKEIKMKPRIGPHDYEIKMRHVHDLLQEGHKVRLTVEIRGNRRINPEIIDRLYAKMLAEVSAYADVDTNTRQVGRNRSVIVSPRPASPKAHQRAGASPPPSPA